MSGLCSFQTTISLTWTNNIWLSFSSFTISVDLFLVVFVIFIHSFLCSENFVFLFSTFLVFELTEVSVSRPLLHKTPPWPNSSFKRELLKHCWLLYTCPSWLTNQPLLRPIRARYKSTLHFSVLWFILYIFFRSEIRLLIYDVTNNFMPSLVTLCFELIEFEITVLERYKTTLHFSVFGLILHFFSQLEIRLLIYDVITNYLQSLVTVWFELIELEIDNSLGIFRTSILDHISRISASFWEITTIYKFQKHSGAYSLGCWLHNRRITSPVSTFSRFRGTIHRPVNFSHYSTNSAFSVNLIPNYDSQTYIWALSYRTWLDCCCTMRFLLTFARFRGTIHRPVNFSHCSTKIYKSVEDNCDLLQENVTFYIPYDDDAWT